MGSFYFNLIHGFELRLRSACEDSENFKMEMKKGAKDTEKNQVPIG